jgi:hypothetical protein
VAILFCRAQVIKRSEGRSAIACAAYRCGMELEDRRTGQRHDYSRKQGVMAQGILAPEGAPEWVQDPGQLWNRVEAGETRKDAQLARELVIAIPHEIEGEYRDYLIKNILRPLVRDGAVAHYALHAPSRDGDERNIHAHVMLTMRRLTADGEFSAKKAREWNEKPYLETVKKTIERETNRMMERLGHDQRVSVELEEGQQPTRHLGRKASWLERKGIKTERGEQNREIEAENERRKQEQERAELAREIAALEAEAARQAIEQAQPQAGEHVPSLSERWRVSAGSRFEASPVLAFGQMPTASRLEISPPQPAETVIQGTEGKEHAPEHRPTAANRSEPSRKTQAGRAFAQVSTAGDGQQGGGERPQTRASPVVRDWNQATAPPRPEPMPEASSPATGKQGEGKGEDAPSLKPSNDNTRRTPRETTRQSFRRRGGAGRSRDRTPDRGGED